jgi:mTERF domain-containing protein
MKYLSENDTAFAARANRSLEEFEEYREEVVPIFRMETLRRKAQADESFQTDLQHHRKREARLEQQHRLLDRNQGYSQRTIDARNSMNRVKLLGVSRKSH